MAITESNPNHAHPSALTRPNASPYALVAPMTAGARTGRNNTGNKVSRTPTPEAMTPYSVPELEIARVVKIAEATIN